MTVKELIEKLSDMNPQKDVVIGQLDREGKPERYVHQIARVVESDKRVIIDRM